MTGSIRGHLLTIKQYGDHKVAVLLLMNYVQLK
jgi:hypothetical protein